MKNYVGDTYEDTLEFLDEDDEYFNPDTVSVVFYDPDGTQSGEALSLGDLTHNPGETGIYQLVWDIPSDAVAGVWKYRAVAVYGDKQKSVEVPFNVATQPYGTLSVVKRLCNLEEVDEQDSTLMGYMDDATEWVNTVLKRHGEASLPLDPVPVEVTKIVNYYAAGMFLQRDVVEGRRHPFVADAKEDLEEYAQATYHGQVSPPGIVKVSSYQEIDED